MLANIKHALDKGLHACILLTDLSKAFDSLSHDDKLYAYGFSKNAFKLILDYLSGRKQRTKVCESFSSWRNIIHGVPQGSILGPLLYIYINDLFLFSENFDIANYADDCTPYEFSGSLQEVINKSEQDALCLIECIHNSENEKLLGVYFDSKLNFKTHVTKLCKKAGQKLHALARISNFMNLNNRKMLMNAFISSQFSYCPLIWMCHSRSLN